MHVVEAEDGRGKKICSGFALHYRESFMVYNTALNHIAITI